MSESTLRITTAIKVFDGKGYRECATNSLLILAVLLAERHRRWHPGEISTAGQTTSSSRHPTRGFERREMATVERDNHATCLLAYCFNYNRITEAPGRKTRGRFRRFWKRTSSMPSTGSEVCWLQNIKNTGQIIWPPSVYKNVQDPNGVFFALDKHCNRLERKRENNLTWPFRRHRTTTRNHLRLRLCQKHQLPRWGFRTGGDGINYASQVHTTSSSDITD